MLLVIGMILNINQPFGIAIAKVGRMRRPIVNLLKKRNIVKNLSKRNHFKIKKPLFHQ